MEEATEEIRSRYQPLETPQFHSSIPKHLMEPLTEKDRYIIEMLGKLDQQANWQVATAIEHRRIQIEMDVRLQRVDVIRLKRLEAWRDTLTGKWVVLSALGSIAVTAAVTVLMTHIFSFMK